MHKSCNGQKANKPFLQWYFEDKKTRDASLRAYFAKAESLIESGKIDDKKYKDYVENATQLIYDTTKGSVDLRKKD